MANELDSRPVLYVVACAAPPVLRIRDLLAAAREDGWDNCLILSPTAARWLDPEITALTRLTGRPVRSQYNLPGQPGGLPPADAVLVAPATANSVNKVAAGISDTLALGVVNQAIARRSPVVVLPCLNGDQAHPAFARSVATLRGVGVTMLIDVDGGGRTGNSDRDRLDFPWHAGLAALTRPDARRSAAASP